ncbi:hypothetical protein ACLH3R_002354 [Flavobacterium psychrophilum]
MTTKILILSIATFFTTTTLSAKAKIPVCFPCETIETTMDLTKDEELKKIAGSEVNLAYLNNEYGLLWTSVWNTNGRYVLSNTSNNMYWEIDETAAQYLKEKHNFDVKTAENPLSFWKKIGGKLVFILVIGFLIWGNIGSKKKDEVKPTNI